MTTVSALASSVQTVLVEDSTNVVFIGPNGVGKSTLTQNVAHQALIAGHTVLCRSASEMLGHKISRLRVF